MAIPTIWGVTGDDEPRLSGAESPEAAPSKTRTQKWWDGLGDEEQGPSPRDRSVALLFPPCVQLITPHSCGHIIVTSLFVCN